MINRYTVPTLFLFALMTGAPGPDVSMAATAASHLMLQLKKSPKLSPKGADIFPTVSDPHLYRQTESVTCENGACVQTFDRVGTNQLLEIDTISCSSDDAQGRLFTSPALDGQHLLAVFQIGNGFGTVTGPFYLASGERPVIQTEGNADSLCSIFGTLWSTG